MVRWIILLWWRLQLETRLHCNILLRLRGLPSVSIFVIPADMHWLFMMICRNKQYLTVKCLWFSVAPRDVKPIRAIFSIYTPVCWSVQPRLLIRKKWPVRWTICPKAWKVKWKVEVRWQHCLLLKLRPEMFLPIFRLMWSLLQTVRYSLIRIYSIKVIVRLLM